MTVIVILLSSLNFVLMAAAAPVALLLGIAIHLSIHNVRLRDQRDLATARWQAVDPMAKKPAPGGRRRHRRSRFAHWEPTAPMFVAAPPTTVLASFDDTHIQPWPDLDAFDREMQTRTLEMRGEQP